MEEVLHYLQLKNQFYEKFYALTVKFIAQANQNQWDDMELFLDNRERILNIIHSFDYKIANLFQKVNLSRNDLERFRSPVRELLDARKSWADKIVALDLELITKMEDIKSETIRELKKSVETSQHLNSYDPGPSPKRLAKPRKDI
jgi:hypothetical protein